MYKTIALAMFIAVFSTSVVAQREDNWAVSANYGLLNMSARVGNLPRDFFTGGTTADPGLTFTNNIPLRGYRMGLELRHSPSDVHTFAIGISRMTATDDNWNVASVGTNRDRAVSVPGQAEFNSFGATAGIYLRVLDPAPWLDWQVGANFEYQFFDLDRTNQISLVATDTGDFEIADTERGSVDGTLWGVAPTMRIAVRPAPSFGLFLDATAGVLFERRANRGLRYYHYSIQIGAFVELRPR